MQLETRGVKTQISGAVGATSRFRMETDAVSFDIFSNGLYSRKIEAVIRELSCNAYDSHIAAGKPHEPFEVQLPTQFEPIFIIKDYGTGLRFTEKGCEKCHGIGKLADEVCDDCSGTGDYDAVIRLYCTYFASNKRSSNEFVGALGLGSKSPFAYTNKKKVDGTHESSGFAVTNRYNGKTYSYTVAVDETGFPAATLMEVFESPNAPNGVEIRFPVSPSDVWEFENTAKYVFEFFNPRPRFIGDKRVSVVEPTYSVRSNLWGMRSNAHTTQTDGLRAISGVVPYSVGNIDVSRLSEAQKKLVDMPIDLFFNIGELSVAASRETLQLDPKTVSNILQRLDAVQEKLMEEVKAKVDACSSAWEARLKIYELMQQPGMGALVNDAYNKGMLDGKYKSFKLNGTKVVINELDYNSIVAVEFRHSDRARKKAKKESLFEATNNNRRADAFRDVAAGVSKKSDYDIRIEVDNRTIFVVNDLTRGSADKYVNFLIQNDDSNTYVKAIVLQRVNKLVALNRAGDESVALLERLGNPPFLKASDLKTKYDPIFKEEKEQQVIKRERMTVRVLNHRHYRARRWGGNNWKKQWSKGDNHPLLEDTEATKFYVLINGHGGEVIPAEGTFTSTSFFELLRRVRESALFPEFNDASVVFGIKKDSKLLSDPTFVELTSFVKTRVKAELTPAKQMAMSLTVKPFEDTWKFVLEYIMEHPMLLSVDSPVRKFALTLREAERIDRTGFTNLSQLAAYFSISIDNTADFNKQWGKVIKEYPMLKICSRKGWGSCTIEEKTIVTDYIRSVDEQRMGSSFEEGLILSDVAVDEDKREVVNA